MIKKEVFDTELQELAQFAKVISHPARLAILKYLAETKTCISKWLNHINNNSLSNHRLHLELNPSLSILSNVAKQLFYLKE